MSIIASHYLSKPLWMGCILTAVLATAGCNKAATDAETANVDTTAETTTVAAPVAAEPTTNEAPFVMTTLGLDAINTMVFTPLVSGDRLSAEEKSCLESRDAKLGQTQLQAFYKDKFSDTELQELDKFYGSSVGKKLLIAGKEEMALRNGEEVANPIAAPTPDEIAKIQTFMQTPVGVKYSQINTAVGEGSALATLEQPVDAEFKRCNIDLTMTQLLQPSAPAVAPTAG